MSPPVRPTPRHLRQLSPVPGEQRLVADSTPTHVRRSAIDTAPATRPAGAAVNLAPRAVVARDRHDSVVRAQHRRPKPARPTGQPRAVGFDGAARIAVSCRVARAARLKSRRGGNCVPSAIYDTKPDPGPSR
jgi:hypothetical protein